MREDQENKIINMCLYTGGIPSTVTSSSSSFVSLLPCSDEGGENSGGNQ